MVRVDVVEMLTTIGLWSWAMPRNGAGVDRPGERRAVHRRRRRERLRLGARRHVEARGDDHADGQGDHGDQGGVEEGRLAR